MCCQGWYICLVAMALAARTYCDVWMIQNGTSIERFLMLCALCVTSLYLFSDEHLKLVHVASKTSYMWHVHVHVIQ